MVVRALTSFYLNVFLKKGLVDLASPRTICNEESQSLLVGSGTATIYSPSNTKFSLKYFNIS